MSCRWGWRSADRTRLAAVGIMRRSIAEHAQEMAVSWTTSSCTPYVGCQPTTRHELGTATAKLHPREDPGRPAGRRGQGNHGGRPHVIDGDMLIFARALKDQGTPIPQIATKLTITTGRTPATTPPSPPYTAPCRRSSRASTPTSLHTGSPWRSQFPIVTRDGAADFRHSPFTEVARQDGRPASPVRTDSR